MKRQGRPPERPNPNMITCSEFSKPDGGAPTETRLQLAQTQLRGLITSSREKLERDEFTVFMEIVAARVAKEIATRARWPR